MHGSWIKDVAKTNQFFKLSFILLVEQIMILHPNALR